MKVKTITYWATTVLFSAMMTMSAVMYLTHNPHMSEAFVSLGYPPYFQNILGVAKLLGVAALLAPRFGLLKEWAYAGFTFTCLGAFISHLASGQGSQSVAPVVALALLAASYVLRPANRRLLTSGTAGSRVDMPSAASGLRVAV